MNYSNLTTEQQMVAEAKKFVNTGLENKVDKVQGKGLSTNDYTDDDKNKLAGIEAGANKTVVDFFMNADSTNPLQNRVVNAFLNEKTDISNFNALTQEFKLFNTYDLTNDVEISVFANKTYKRASRFYESHIPNLDGEYSVSLGDKTFTETCTFTIANEGKSITEVFHTNRKYILGAKLLKAENDEVGDAHIIADVVTLLISKDAPYTTTFDPDIETPPATGVLTLKVSVKPDEKYVNEENTGGPAEYAYWGSYNGSDLLINNPILTYSETTFGQPKVSGNPITINDAAPANAVDVSVNIEPIQDLHGYDHPWVGGAGKNKLNMVDVLPSGSYNGNIFICSDVGNRPTVVLFDSPHTITFSYTKGEFTGSGARLEFLNGSSVLTSKGLTSETPTSQTVENVTSVRFNFGSGGTLKITEPQIELGSTATSFAPYTNICPISGRSEVAIDDVGKNISTGVEQGSFDTNGVNGSSNTRCRSIGYIPVTADTEYIIDCKSNNVYATISYFANNTNIERISGTTWESLPYKFTPPSNCRYIRVMFSFDSGAQTNITPSDIINLIIADNPKTYTIQLGDAIYGGELDVLTGKLVVTHGEVDLGTLNYDKATQYGYTSFYGSVIANKKFNSICSNYVAVEKARDSLNNGEIGVYNTSNSFSPCIRDDAKADLTVEQFKTAMSGVQLVYELAEPYTIQLTPQQIRLLKGTNNISCNTGDLSIKYYPDNVLGQLKGDIESEYDERVETLETQVQELQPSLIFMSRERRDITSDLSRLSIAVAEQNLEKYGYKIGDYFERVDGNRTYTYHIADYNTFKGTSTPYCLTTNHIGIVVDTHQTSQWHSGDASNVGYNGSVLNTFLKGTVLDNIKADMIYFFGGTTGLEHLLAHSKLLTTALANWGWQANQYISALSEVQTIGSTIWSANSYQTGEAAKKLELFDKYKWTEIFEGRYPWLRDLYTSSGACILNDSGYATNTGVANSRYAVGLINFY